ncbi:hypothetical protein SDC9_150959 [bioreactor metagenome]|uniref:AMIN domain-containing protein n=1 Tax=bioreactor metagenome TaxID=1076179 RepID=A0A645EPI6_9ZZZZ
MYKKIVIAALLISLASITLFAGCTNVPVLPGKSSLSQQKAANVSNTEMKLSVEDIKKKYAGKNIIAITKYKDNYIIVESNEGIDASTFELYNLTTGDRDILPTGPNYAELKEISNENHITFIADGRTHINSFRDFPFEIICKRVHEVLNYDGDFTAEYISKYFSLSEKTEFGDRDGEILSDIRSTLTGLEILFKPAKGKEAEFFAGATSAPKTRTSYNSDNNQLVIEFLNTGLENISLDSSKNNYYVNSVEARKVNSDTQVLVSLKDTARYFTAKCCRIPNPNNELPYIRFEFSSEN